MSYSQLQMAAVQDVPEIVASDVIHSLTLLHGVCNHGNSVFLMFLVIWSAVRERRHSSGIVCSARHYLAGLSPVRLTGKLPVSDFPPLTSENDLL